MLVNNEFSLCHNGYVILEHSATKPLLFVGIGSENVKMYRGNFKIEDYITERNKLKLTEVVESNGNYKLNFNQQISVFIEIVKDKIILNFIQINPDLNRFFIRLNSQVYEKIFGLGEQMSYLNLKGRSFPIFTSESGVGRDKSTYITWKADVEGQAGGDYYNTNFPQPTFISSNLYFLHLDSTAYSNFNFKNDSFTEIEVWEIPRRIIIQAGSSYFDLLEKLTDFLGRQPELPDWVYNGVILGLQGGNDRIMNLLEKSLRAKIKVSALWAQDWCGKRITSFGKRIDWNWQYNEDMYPHLPSIIDELHGWEIKFLGYLNPYLVSDGPLYIEAKERGYFATKQDGSDYLVDFGEFDCGIVDLTNPKAFNWFKNHIIKKQAIDIGMDGWMADFGEYLPVDSDLKLFNNKSAMIEHNHWPVLWAKCNHDAVNESGKSDELLFFMRAGGSGSAQYCPLLWAGDQSVDFSIHDGLASTIVAALSSGMSGFGLNHSDIGGYTSLYDNVRTKELFLRWAEMAAFTPIMRTHEGNRPDDNFQFYNDDDCLMQFARLTNIYVSLKEYIKAAVLENSQKGIPVQRPLFLHYPEDLYSFNEQFEYLLGPDLLVCPVFEANTSIRDVYLPEDNWIHLWTGTKYTKGVYHIDAKLGYPPVFYKADSSYAGLFESIRNRFTNES